VEGHALPEVHAPGGVVEAFPRLGQPADHLAGLAVGVDQAVVDVHLDPLGGGVPAYRGIPVLDTLPLRYDDLPLGEGEGEEEQDRYGCEEGTNYGFH
jgi:hypothetical protein